MNKNMLMAAVCLASAVFISALPFPALAAQISEETAKSIALGDSGVKEDDTAWLHVKAELEDGRQVYEVKFFTKAYVEYQYELLAEDGSVLSVEYDAGATLSNHQDALKHGTSVITSEKARETALSHAGAKSDDVTFTKTSSELENGRQVYDIEFYTKDNREYDFEIDAATGIIVNWKYEAAKTSPDYQDAGVNAGTKETADSSTQDAIEQAKALALRTAGLTADEVTWGRVHPDYDDGKLIYEGKFFCGQMEYEFEIDAATMSIVDWDMENIYD